MFVAIWSQRTAFVSAFAYSTETMPRPTPRLRPPPSIRGVRIELGAPISVRFALSRTQLFVTHAEVKTKFVCASTCSRFSLRAHAGRYFDTPFTVLSSSQSPPRNCLSSTESMTMSVRTSSIVPPTSNLTEQSFVV